MKMPKGWREIGKDYYYADVEQPWMCTAFRMVYLLTSEFSEHPPGWYAWKRNAVSTPSFGPFQTAREAFAALGVEVK